MEYSYLIGAMENTNNNKNYNNDNDINSTNEINNDLSDTTPLVSKDDDKDFGRVLWVLKSVSCLMSLDFMVLLYFIIINKSLFLNCLTTDCVSHNPAILVFSRRQPRFVWVSVFLIQHVTIHIHSVCC